MALVLIHNSAKRQSVLEDDELDMNEEQMEEREVLRRNSNIPRMETAFNFYKSKAAGLMKEHDPDKISQDAFKDIIKDAGTRFMGCLGLPFTFLFFLIFAMSTILHADVKNAFLLESGLKGYVSQNVDGVETIGDAWNWMENTMLPTFFATEAPETNHTNKNRWRPVLTYNRMIGPMMLSQIRAQKSLCTKPLFNDMMCYDQDTRDTNTFGETAPTINVPNMNEYGATCSANDPVDTSRQITSPADFQVKRQDFWNQAFRVKSSIAPARRLREVSGAQGKYPPMPGNDEQTLFVSYLYPNVLKSTAQEQLAYLKQRGWIDEQTISVELSAVLLNAEVGRPRLTQVKVSFLFSRAGGTFTVVDTNTIFLKFWPSVMSESFWADILLICLLCGMLILQVYKLHGSDPDKWKKCLSSWNILQWAIVICGWCCIGLHFITYVLTSTLGPIYTLVSEAQKNDVPAECNSLGAQMHEEVNNFSYFNGTTRFFFAMYHQLLILRFFTAFHAQPRLGVVTKTLEVSLIDILHFLVVLLPTFLSYAVSGCFIFGKRVQEFSDLPLSVGTCFKIFMESEYDWPLLSEEYWWTPFFWVFSFMILLVMIMLNMVLAIVLDVYTEIRKKSGQSEPVWVTAYHMFQRLRHWRRWVKMEAILEKIPLMPANISRETIHETFPNMCNEQVEQIFAAARYHTIASEQGNEKDARKLALAVKLVVDKINDTMVQLDNGVCTNDKYDESAKGWLPDLAREMASQNHMMLSLQWHLQQIEWQWQAMDTIHGSDFSFSGQHKLPSKEHTIL